MKLTLDNRAALDFVLTLRRRWADTLYPRLRAEYDTHMGAEPPNTPEVVAAQVHALPSYNGFAWLERGSQKMLWRAAIDSVRTEEEAAEPTGGEPGPATLELDPGLKLPNWYTDWDIHVQPGGMWSSLAAARVYELGAKLVMLGDNDDYELHRLFVATAIPERDYRRIIDLGCGFGKSAWPLKKTYPNAEVIGIDLAAPCLKLAVERSNAKGLAIRFRQADAGATELESGQAGLVTATMLIHELPLDPLQGMFQEAARLLAPGGLLRILDFQCTGDAVRDLAMREHGARNNEPFMPPMLAADTAAMAEAAGFRNARWTAFDERDVGRLPTLVWPKRAEWHFPWAVLEAEHAA
ncbi:MAG: class I SAM-dependent methyltransferase [Steroidobacteraceae bacterium]